MQNLCRVSSEMFAAMVLSMGRRIVVHRPAEMHEKFRRLARQAMEAADESSERQ